MQTDPPRTARDREPDEAAKRNLDAFDDEWVPGMCANPPRQVVYLGELLLIFRSVGKGERLKHFVPRTSGPVDCLAASLHRHYLDA